MKTLTVAIVALAWLACGTPVPQPPAITEVNLDSFQVLDLTHTLNSKSIYWPTGKPFDHQQTSWGTAEGGYFYSSYDFFTSEHLGTHLDAPIHFAANTKTVEQIPLDQLIGRGVVIDIVEACKADPDYLLSAADIEAFESANGPIAAGSIVLVRTDWSRFWPDTKQYLGDDTPGATNNLHFPGIAAGAAQALADRKVGAVGIDTASIDNGPSTDFMTHQILMKAGIPGLENLTGLDGLPARGAWILALPMKIGEGSGAPLRIAALLPPPAN